MKRIFFATAVFFVAAVLGFGISLFTTPAVTAYNICVDMPRGPIHVLSCDTGELCSEPTPYYVYDCYGFERGSTIPCDCEWIGCSSICF